MALDAEKLGKDMIAAAMGVFKKKWPEIQEYAEKEMKDYASTLVDIEAAYLNHKITEDRARSHVRAQAKSMEIVFLAVEGMGILMVEAAIDAAIGAIRKGVNTALGFALL